MSPRESIGARTRRRLGASKYLRDVLWQASGNSAAQLLGIAAMPILTRLYAPSDFGALHLFLQFVAALSIIMTLRFEYLVVLPADQAESNRVLRLVVRLGALHVVLWTPLLMYLPGQWERLNAQGAISTWLWLAPLSAWGVSVAVGLQQAVQRQGKYQLSAGSEFVGRCAYVACALIGSQALPNLVGLMAATASNAAAKLCWLIRNSNEWTGSLLRTESTPVAFPIKRLAASTSISNLIALVSGMAPMLFIADRYGASALGQYGLVVSTLYLPTMLLGQAIGQVYYQRACRLHGEESSFAGLLVQTSQNLLKIGAPTFVVIAMLSPLAYPAVFGSEWGAAGDIARWMCLAAGLAFVSTPMDRTSLIVGAWWYLTVWHIFRSVGTIAVIVIGYIYGLTLEAFVLLLSLQNAVAYALDWLASYMFATRARCVEVPRGKSSGGAAA